MLDARFFDFASGQRHFLNTVIASLVIGRFAVLSNWTEVGAGEDRTVSYVEISGTPVFAAGVGGHDRLRHDLVALRTLIAYVSASPRAAHDSAQYPRRNRLPDC